MDHLYAFIFIHSILSHPSFFPSIDISEPVDVYSNWIDACEAANQ